MGYEVINADEVPTDESGRLKSIYRGEDHALAFTRTFLAPGKSSPPEDFVIHPDCDQIEYILFGRGTAAYPDGTTHELRPGTAVYHEAGQPHRFDNDGDEPLIFVVATVVNDKDGADRVAYRAEGD